MGRRSETFFVFLTLGIGITMAFFHLVGTLADVRLRFNRYVNSGVSVSMASLTSRLLRSGMPQDL